MLKRMNMVVFVICVALDCGYEFLHQQIDQWIMSQYMTVANFRVPNVFIYFLVYEYDSYFQKRR